MLLKALPLAILLVVLNALPCLAQDASTKNALDALDKALEQNNKKDSQESTPKTPSASIATEKGIFDIPGLYLGMTCEQARAALGSFKGGNCVDCKINSKCIAEAKVVVEELEYSCTLYFDATNCLYEISLHRSFRNDRYAGGMVTALELFNKYVEKISKVHGKPRMTEDTKTEKMRVWVASDYKFVLFFKDHSENIIITYSKN